MVNRPPTLKRNGELIMSNLTVIKEQEVLGQEFKMYGTFDEPLFLAKNVAEWIDYSKDGKGNYNVSAMLAKVDEDEKVKHFTNLNNSKVGSNTWFLTEDGLYEVLMQSRKPIAKAFKKEVKSILKKLRKGNLSVPSYQIDDDVARATRWIQERQNFEKVALAYKKTSDERNYLAQEVISHEERLGENKNLHTVTLIAGKFGLTANKLNSILVEQKIQYKKGKTYHLYAGYKDKGLAEHVAVTISEDKVIYNLKWTEKGFHFIVRLLRSMDYTTEAPIQNFQTHFNLLSEGYTTESSEVKELSGAVSEMNKVDLNSILTADVVELPMPTKEDK